MHKYFLVGPALIILGIIYMIKPNLFRRGIWKKTAISQQILTPSQNDIYMRVLGLIFILIGIYMSYRWTI